MPLYDYECSACDNVYAVICSYEDDSIEPCPDCGCTNTNRLFPAPAGKVSGGYSSKTYTRGTTNE